MSSAIESTTTVNDFVQKYPEAIRVFAAFGIDTCCGGNLPIEIAAAKHGIDPTELIAMLSAAIDTAGHAQRATNGASCDLAGSAGSAVRRPAEER